jgi:membrane protein YdbS with pleckstrin-like domain
MANFFGTTGILTSILVGAIVWFVLDVIIGVAVWISFVAGGAVALLGCLVALGLAARAATEHSHHRQRTVAAH